MADDVQVVDNPARSRFEVRVGGDLAGFLTYRMAQGRVILVHTEVHAGYEGHGVGARLVAAALDDLRSRGLSVVPRCPYVAAFIGKHPDYRDLVARPS